MTEIPDVVEIVGRNIDGNLGTGKKGLNHSLNTLFPELVGKLVEVRDAILDMRLLRVINGASTDRPVPRPTRPVPETCLLRERVHQPGLAAGQFPDPCRRALFEDLPCLLRVLAMRALVSPLVKSPRRSDSALMLKALPPMMCVLSRLE